MSKYVFIMDISKTLVMMSREGEEKFNPYDEALRVVSLIEFCGIEMNMKMSADGKLFPDHIAAVIEEAYRLSGGPCDIQDFRRSAEEVIDLRMRAILVRRFSERPVLAAPGMERFVQWLKGIHGIVTGDLRAVARVIMKYNTYGDLTFHFPEILWTCGDDPGLTSRADQVKTTYEKLGESAQGKILVLVDDAANGIKAMKEFIQGKNINYVIIGVETGNSGREELRNAGANIVLPNIGFIPDILG